MAFVIAYIDTSVVLRIVLEDENPLSEWAQIITGFASELLAVEVRRTLDRFWIEHKLTGDDFAAKSADAESMMKRIHQVELDRRVLGRVARPFPTSIATLDAIHLTTALFLREAQPALQPALLFATHDHQLARAARAMHFEVIGA